MHCLIIEDHPVTLLGLRLLIQNNFPVWKVTTATSVKGAIQCIDTADNPPIGLVLLDITLPDQSGIALLKHFYNADSPRFLCIVVSSLTDQDTIDLCKAHGAHGYMSKNKALNRIIHAIQVVISGGAYFHTDEVNVSHASMNNSIASTKLTERQRDLIDLVMAGYSNKRIAETLNLSYGTVKNYMFDLMRLLSVRSRLEMVVKIRESGYKTCRAESFYPAENLNAPE